MDRETDEYVKHCIKVKYKGEKHHQIVISHTIYDSWSYFNN